MDEENDPLAYMDDDYDPTWLRKGLIDGAFPWEAGYSGTLAHFLDRYTVHDSLWVGLWLQPTGKAIAVIRWDLAWNEPVDDKEESEDIPFWPILLIRFTKLHAFTVIDGTRSGAVRGGEFLLFAESRPLESAETGGHHETLVHGQKGMEIRLLHDPGVCVLLINRSGETVPIPDI